MAEPGLTAASVLPVTLAVMAKEPVAGRSKTRLSPPFSPAEAARLAEAALADTLHNVVASRARRTVLVLDGAPGAWLPDGIEVIAQTTGGLDRRLAAAFSELGGPTLMLGADTPQLGAATIDAAMAALVSPEVDAVLGPATDGGYWVVGLRRPVPAAFTGVPMSTPWTFATQRRRLKQLGLSVQVLAEARDVDDITDARVVARRCPGSAFTETFDRLVRSD